MHWPRPGERGYYAYPLVSLCVLSPVLLTAEPVRLAAVFTALMSAGVLYRFLRYPPRSHSEVLRARRGQRLLAGSDLRRPD